MELNDLIPEKFRPIHNSNWIVKGKFLMFKKIEHIPIAYLEDDTVYVFLDVRIVKEVIRLVKYLVNSNIEFYFTSPKMSDPKGVDNYKDHIVSHYIYSYSNKEFFYKIRNIDNFDFIQNMVNWCKKEKCLDLIKINYDLISNRVSKESYDYYSNRSYFTYDEEIREEFRTLYRDIQISLLF